MSSLIAKLWTRLCPKRAPLSIMIVGLDNSGKTSILNLLASLNHHGSGNSTSSYHSQAQQQEPSNVATTTPTTTKQPTASGGSSATSATTSPLSTASIGLLLTDDSRSDSSLAISGSNRTSSPSGGGHAGNIMPTVGYNYERLQYRSLTITVLDFSGQNRYRNLWQEFYNGVDGIVFVIDSSDLIRFVVVRDELETMLSHPYFNSLSAASGDMRGASGNNNLANAASLQLLAPNSAAATVQKQLTISQGKLVQTTLADSGGSSHHPSMLSSASSAVANKFASGSSIVLGHHIANNNNQQQTTKAKKGAGSGSSGGGHHQSRRRSKVPILFLANKTDLPNSVDTEVIAKALNLNQLPTDRHPWFIQATSINLNQGIVEGFDWLVSQLTAASN